jgi:hypothetical protein
VNEKTLAHRYKACGKSLDRLQNECRQTFNLLASVTHFPVTMEKITALDFQRRREDAAQDEYSELMRKLFELLGDGSTNLSQG